MTLFNTSDFNDLQRAASLLRVVPLLRQSRVLVSPPFERTPESFAPEKVKERLGVELVAIADGRYDEVLAAVDAKAAEADAQGWIDGAKQVVEPKLLYNWGGGALGTSAKDYYASLHRVAYYGDHTRDLRHLAHLLGLRFVQEV